MLTIAPTLTNKGRSLLVRGLAGETITFTGFKVGNGTLPDNTDQDDLTDLNNPLKSFSITSLIQNQTRGYVTLTGHCDSAANSAAWKFKELGVFAKGEDNIEWLYAYAYDPDNGSTLPDTTSGVIVEQYVEVIVAIGEAENVNAIVTQNTLYASAEDFNSHVQDYGNPHRVTPAQVGLENVPNVSTNDQTPTWDETLTGETQTIASGSHLSAILAKLALAVRNLKAHIQNKNNPHSVTPGQIGAAAVNHEHSAVDVTSGVLSVERGGTGVGSYRELSALLTNNLVMDVYQGDGNYIRYFNLGFKPTKVLIFPLNTGSQSDSANKPYCFEEGKNIYHAGCGSGYYTSTDAVALLNRKHGGALVTSNGFVVGDATNGSGSAYPDVNASDKSYLYIAFR